MEKDVDMQKDALVNALPGMVYQCAIDERMALLSVSSGAFDLIGETSESLLGQHACLQQYIFPDDLYRVQLERKQAIQASGHYAMEYRLMTNIGKLKYVHDEGRQIEINGQPCFVGFISDATVRIRQQQRRHHVEKAILAAALSQYLASGAIMDFVGEVVQLAVNTLNIDQAGVWLFNAERTELRLISIGRRGHSPESNDALLKVEDYPVYFDTLLRGRVIDASDAFADSRTQEFVDVYLPSTGVVSLLDATIRLAGEVVGVLCCENKFHKKIWQNDEVAFACQLADQISLAMNNARRIDAEKKAIQAETRSEAKSHFLASMSHEIRTPMNGVLGMAELMRMSSLTAEQEQYLSIIEESGGLLLNIIDEILDFSKLEAGKFQLQESSCDVERLFAGVVNLLKPGALPQVKIEFDIPADFPGEITIDGHRLRQILLNLIGNAVKFTRHGKVVVKVLLLEGKRWQFSVEDTGMGIEPDLLERLFEPFERGRHVKNIAGTGLGLAICYRLVHLMNGSIFASSTIGEGSVFTVQLPLNVVAQAAGAEPPHQSTGADYACLHVLVAEDNPINQTVIKGMLHKLGINPVICDNGLHAVQVFTSSQEKFDVILMDCEMPEMDGYAAAKEIRRQEKGKLLHIAAITAHALPENRKRSEEAGMNFYLTKPLKLDDLKQLMQQVMMPPPVANIGNGQFHLMEK